MTLMFKYLCGIGSCAFIPVILTLSAVYAYQVNTSKAFDDPKKREFSPYAPWLAPITLPLLFLINGIFFVLASLVFGVFLVIFPFTLLVFRLGFLINWIRKQALRIGNWVLKINTWLLKVAGFHPSTIRLQYEQNSSR